MLTVPVSRPQWSSSDLGGAAIILVFCSATSSGHVSVAVQLAGTDLDLAGSSSSTQTSGPSGAPLVTLSPRRDGRTHGSGGFDRRSEGLRERSINFCLFPSGSVSFINDPTSHGDLSRGGLNSQINYPADFLRVASRVASMVVQYAVVWDVASMIADWLIVSPGISASHVFEEGANPPPAAPCWLLLPQLSRPPTLQVRLALLVFSRLDLRPRCLHTLSPVWVHLNSFARLTSGDQDDALVRKFRELCVPTGMIHQGAPTADELNLLARHKQEPPSDEGSPADDGVPAKNSG